MEPAVTYWIRLDGQGYLSYDGRSTYNINDIRDFTTLAKAVRASMEWKNSAVIEVQFTQKI